MKDIKFEYDGVEWTISIEEATKILKDLYSEWYCGLEEVRAEIKFKDSEIERLREELKKYESRN